VTAQTCPAGAAHYRDHGSSRQYSPSNGQRTCSSSGLTTP
jgi:hypothetical protein